MHRVAYLAITCLAGLVVSASTANAAPIALTRVSSLDARGAAHAIFDNLAAAMDKKLIVSPCVARGRLARVCILRIDTMRFRLVASPIGSENMRVSVVRLRSTRDR